MEVFLLYFCLLTFKTDAMCERLQEKDENLSPPAPSFPSSPAYFLDGQRLAVSCFTAFMAIQHGNC
jgi:hypothetical protein